MRSVVNGFRVRGSPYTQLNQRRYFSSSKGSLFLNDFVNSVAGNGQPRLLTARRTLNYPKPQLFSLVASIDNYPTFLPFIHSCKVLARDTDGWPSRATLDIGYAGYNESFTSQIESDEKKGTVRAKAGNNASQDQKIQEEGMFQTLDTLWQFSDMSKSTGAPATEAFLSVKVKFRNPMYDAFLAAVENKVATTMIEAFEKRLKETCK